MGEFASLQSFNVCQDACDLVCSYCVDMCARLCVCVCVCVVVNVHGDACVQLVSARELWSDSEHAQVGVYACN